MVDQIYSSELQLNKANSSNTEALFLGLNLSITNGIVSSKTYDKRDDFKFEIVNFLFLYGDVSRRHNVLISSYKINNFSFCWYANTLSVPIFVLPVQYMWDRNRRICSSLI